MGTLAAEWEWYTKSLYETCISLNTEPDRIIWKAKHHIGVVKAHLAYIVSLKTLEEPEGREWHSALWKIKMVGKIKYFVWLAINYKIITWDALQQCGYIGSWNCI